MRIIILIFLFIFSNLVYSEVNLLDSGIQVNEHWKMLSGVEAIPKKKKLTLSSETGGILTSLGGKNAGYLKTKDEYGDCHIVAEIMIPHKGNAGIYVQGSYEIQVFDSFKKKLSYNSIGAVYHRWDDKHKKGYEGVPPLVDAAKPAGEWQEIEILFRAPRMAPDGSVLEFPIFLEVKVNGQLVQENAVVKGYTRSSPVKTFNEKAPLYFQGDHGPVAIRKFTIQEMDFAELSHEQEKFVDNSIDLVAIGKEKFHGLGCAECHSLEEKSEAVKTGPSLYGVFQEKPIKHSIITSGEEHLREVLADFNYLSESIRQPVEKRAINGEFTDQDDARKKAYLAIMPPYNEEIISDQEVQAIWHYLKTYNKENQAGPKSYYSSKKIDKSQNPYEIFTNSISLFLKS